MEEPQKAEKENISKQINYAAKDFIILENPQVYSSIGKMVDSKKKTEPMFGFGTSDRQKMEKVFATKQLSKTQFLGKIGPGPVYDPKFDTCVSKPPEWTFGTDIRNALNIKEKYDHYRIIDKYSDTNTADLKRRPECKGVKFRVGNRVS